MDHVRARYGTPAAAGFVIMWSSGFVGAQLSAQEAGSLTVLMWRFVVAAAVLSSWWLMTQRRRLPARDVALQSCIGLLAQGVYLLGVFSSIEFGVSPGVSSLITALQPITAATFAGWILHEQTSLKQWLGLLIGLFGVALVVKADLQGVSDAPVWAYLLSFLAMAGLVSATLLERKTNPRTSLGDALVIQCLASAGLFSVLALGTGMATPPPSGGFWAAVLWLVALSTLGGYGFYWLNLRIGSVTRVSSLIYLTPPTTMFWSLLMFGDTIGLLAGVGMSICMVAVLMARDASPDVGKACVATPRSDSCDHGRKGLVADRTLRNEYVLRLRDAPSRGLGSEPRARPAHPMPAEEERWPRKAQQ